MEDAVEKKVEGLAERIIEEDSEKRAQELVSVPLRHECSQAQSSYAGLIQHRAQTSQLGLETRNGEEAV